MKHKKIEDFLAVAKTDIIFYAILTLLFLIGLLIYGYIKNFYYIAFFDIFMLLATLSRIDAYFNLKKIYNYLKEKDVLDRIGLIDYWNEKNYFLAENCMAIKDGKNVYAFEYSEIREMYKELYNEVSKNTKTNEYLHICLVDNEFKILISTTLLVDCDYMDISDYLLKKNPNIKVLDKVRNTKINIFRFGNKKICFNKKK